MNQRNIIISLKTPNAPRHYLVDTIKIIFSTMRGRAIRLNQKEAAEFILSRNEKYEIEKVIMAIGNN